MSVMHNVQFIRQESPRLCWLTSLQMLIRYELGRGRPLNQAARGLLQLRGRAAIAAVDRLASDQGLAILAKDLGLRKHLLPAQYGAPDTFGRVEGSAPAIDVRMIQMARILDVGPFVMPCLVRGTTPGGLGMHVVLVRGYREEGADMVFALLDPADLGPSPMVELEYRDFLREYAPHGGVVYSC